uniref:(northern house mosquito) hypothetical protein n=1 Tax=Culex pipiens TaxID=7175 RepID=A0A8D8DU34_CULPI
MLSAGPLGGAHQRRHAAQSGPGTVQPAVSGRRHQFDQAFARSSPAGSERLAAVLYAGGDLQGVRPAVGRDTTFKTSVGAASALRTDPAVDCRGGEDRVCVQHDADAVLHGADHCGAVPVRHANGDGHAANARLGPQPLRRGQFGRHQHHQHQQQRRWISGWWPGWRWRRRK